MPADRDRYQTIFASRRGLVAAPTAELHCTPEMLDDLAARGVERGPHAPRRLRHLRRVERVEEHVVDPELYEISDAAAADQCRQRGPPIIAVGTTTTRALEDAAMRGGGTVPAGPPSRPSSSIRASSSR